MSTGLTALGPVRARHSVCKIQLGSSVSYLCWRRSMSVHRWDRGSSGGRQHDCWPRLSAVALMGTATTNPSPSLAP